ncbi:ubiquinone biosynthesis regulatory protein kinase UbiB [Candidatus Schneideria nysicola]|uniref:ubiquinone biosynthesis regulatory protein kinase UbiB n=1 Tax=Candidatus Schneideria nysicola TaxID=1081631 RepID=UPI001CAA63FF|nr:ubiquinone biosynthesis regulatory protein kinase UbiB [Candidatus Schneideria nysicola]UAJ65771.1 ubiquinone biosynthesis regulatory protein kinase UbiB [Candidatus Schneideria nysicola]
MFFYDIYRFYLIIRTLLIYGLDDFIPKEQYTLSLRLGRKFFFWIRNRFQDHPLGERLRLALQELGPMWIKLGQMLSTRPDLFSSMVIHHLSMLQDRVKPLDGNIAKEYIERYIGKPLTNWIYDFQTTPIASASIAQVHTAKLKKNGKEIVIKLIRPDILPLIKADLSLLFSLAKFTSYFFKKSSFFNLKKIVVEYEKTILGELNLLRETANALKLRRNFRKSKILYIPEVYSDYCSENVMVMERIYGIPINNIQKLKKQRTNMKLLAERGVQIFFTQVFRDNFFHGDMHPGNIFVSLNHPEDPVYIGIDFGIVGTLSKKDKRYLIENFSAFFKQDYYKVAQLHIDSGWVPLNTNIIDFESAIRTVCEPIFDKPLSEISFGRILSNLFHTARQFNMEIQPQFILLQKTLLYVEGIGRQLYPQLDLWKTAKPFIEKWGKDQIKMTSVLRLIKDNSSIWIERLPEFPEMLFRNLEKNTLLQESIALFLIENRNKHVKNSQAFFLFSIGAMFLLCGILFLKKDCLEEKLYFPIIFIGGAIGSWIRGWNKLK